MTTGLRALQISQPKTNGRRRTLTVNQCAPWRVWTLGRPIPLPSVRHKEIWSSSPTSTWISLLTLLGLDGQDRLESIKLGPQEPTVITNLWLFWSRIEQNSLPSKARKLSKNYHHWTLASHHFCQAQTCSLGGHFPKHKFSSQTCSLEGCLARDKFLSPASHSLSFNPHVQLWLFSEKNMMPTSAWGR